MFRLGDGGPDSFVLGNILEIYALEEGVFLNFIDLESSLWVFGHHSGDEVPDLAIEDLRVEVEFLLETVLEDDVLARAWVRE